MRVEWLCITRDAEQQHLETTTSTLPLSRRVPFPRVLARGRADVFCRYARDQLGLFGGVPRDDLPECVEVIGNQ